MFGSINWDFALRFLNITLIDLALSGDNAIVIGMAAAALPRDKRKWAIILGGTGAIVLRIALTSVATLLMSIPFLSAAGGLVLIWVAYKLLRLDVREEELEEEERAKRAKNFRQAIMLIVAADFMMSLDNVIAVAGSAHGSVTLLVAGLLISMPLLMTTGAWISLLVDRFRWLVFVGAFAITFTATRMIFEDRFIDARFHQPAYIVLTVAAFVGLLIPAIFILMNKQREKARAGVQVVIEDNKGSSNKAE